MATFTVTVGNKKTFPVDAATGRVLVTPADLEEISDFTIAIDGAEKVPQWTAYSLDYTDFSTGATSTDIELFSLPAGSAVHAVYLRTTTSFAGGAISDYDISVGITGTLAKYLAAVDVDGGSSGSATTFGVESFSAATSIKVAATSAGANLNAATAGACTIYVLTSSLVDA